jgi:hypothetical protein
VGPRRDEQPAPSLGPSTPAYPVRTQNPHRYTTVDHQIACPPLCNRFLGD